jgi:hypothetical protein
MDESHGISVRHFVIFALFHLSTVVVLAFWIGVAYNRLASVEQHTSDNASVIRTILDSGTPANRVEFQMLGEQLKEIQDRIDRIDKNTR